MWIGGIITRMSYGYLRESRVAMGGAWCERVRKSDAEEWSARDYYRYIAGTLPYHGVKTFSTFCIQTIRISYI